MSVAQKFTFDGVPIVEGMEVILLQVPVMGQHEFKHGKVVKISAKTVHVEYMRKERWSYNGEEPATVKRQPEQLIAVRKEPKHVVE